MLLQTHLRRLRSLRFESFKSACRYYHNPRREINGLTPLLSFESAVLQYPSQQFTDSPVHEHGDIRADNISTVDFEIGLEEDIVINQLNRDLLLEAEGALQLNNNEQLEHLQPHWQKSALQYHKPLYLDLQIYPNTECKTAGGGNILLGRNASGKSLITKSLIHSLQSSTSTDEQKNPYLQSGSLHMNSQSESLQKHARYNQFLSHVSFESHSQLLSTPISVHRALIPGGGNRLSPTAQFLIVRLGMFPLLQRMVDTLSTGEIRRVLLVQALVTKPSLLLLDNVMDGLDIAGRQGVQNILERVLSGFRMDILVQGISAKDTARTQVLLSTLRSEEISDGFDRVTFVGDGRIRSEARKQRSGVDLLHCLNQWNEDEPKKYDESIRSLSDKKHENSDNEAHDVHYKSNIHIPSTIEINNFWESAKPKSACEILVEAKELKVIRDDTTLLSELNWTVQRGEKWHLAGTNGAGKSTLGRLLLRKSMNKNLSDINDALIADGLLKVVTEQHCHHSKRGGVGWVSTELHLHAANKWKDRSLVEILTVGAGTLFDLDRSKECKSQDSNDLIDIDMCTIAMQWLGLIDMSESANTNHPFFSRKFSTLSQGQQKLLLLASSIAQRPSLLILDEPCQGLDVWNRSRVLGLVDAICKTTDMSLIYITHHEEELIDGIDNVLRLEDGKVVHCGARLKY